MDIIPEDQDSKRVAELVAHLQQWAGSMDGHGASEYAIHHLRAMGSLHRHNTAILLAEVRNLLAALDLVDTGSWNSGTMRTGSDDRL